MSIVDTARKATNPISIIVEGIKAITGIMPNKNKAREIEAAAQQALNTHNLELAKLQLQIAIEQIKVNAIEAGSDSKYKSWGRPTIIWICAISIGYTYIISPFLADLAILYTGHEVKLTKLSMDYLMFLSTGLLGLGAMRSYDKSKQINKEQLFNKVRRQLNNTLTQDQVNAIDAVLSEIEKEI